MDSYVKYCKIVDGHAWTVVVANYLIKNDREIKCKLSRFDDKF